MLRMALATSRRRLVVLFGIMLLLGAHPASAQAPFIDCDKLAANPTDARKHPSAAGVQFKQVRENVNAALSACANAMEVYPQELRFRYQYARALQAKDKKTAFQMFTQLAKANYPAAYDNVGWLLISELNDYESAVKAFQAGYALGDADCAVSLFEMINREKWQPFNADRVKIELLEKAASSNHAGAMIALPIERSKQGLSARVAGQGTSPAPESADPPRYGKAVFEVQFSEHTREEQQRINATLISCAGGVVSDGRLNGSAAFQMFSRWAQMKGWPQADAESAHWQGVAIFFSELLGSGADFVAACEAAKAQPQTDEKDTARKPTAEPQQEGTRSFGNAQKPYHVWNTERRDQQVILTLGAPHTDDMPMSVQCDAAQSNNNRLGSTSFDNSERNSDLVILSNGLKRTINGALKSGGMAGWDSAPLSDSDLATIIGIISHDNVSIQGQRADGSIDRVVLSWLTPSEAKERYSSLSSQTYLSKAEALEKFRSLCQRVFPVSRSPQTSQAPQSRNQVAVAEGSPQLYRRSQAGSQKVGYVDRNNCWIIDPQFQFGGEFSDGLAVVGVNDKAGFIDANGKMVISPVFLSAGKFSEGLIPAQKKSAHKYKDCYGNGFCGSRYDRNTWGYINRSGEFVIEDVYEDANSFSEGMGLVMISRRAKVNGGKYAYINRDGGLAIQDFYLRAGSFSEGLAFVQKAGQDKLGYIDRSGTFVISPQFNAAGTFSDGLAPVQLKSGKWGYIDRYGKLRIEAIYSEAKGFSDGYAAVKLESGKWVFIDKFGAVAIRPQISISQAVKVTAGVGLVYVQHLEPVYVAGIRTKKTEWVEEEAYIDTQGKMVLATNCRGAR